MVSDHLLDPDVETLGMVVIHHCVASLVHVIKAVVVVLCMNEVFLDENHLNCLLQRQPDVLRIFLVHLSLTVPSERCIFLPDAHFLKVFLSFTKTNI